MQEVVAGNPQWVADRDTLSVAFHLYVYSGQTVRRHNAQRNSVSVTLDWWDPRATRWKFNAIRWESIETLVITLSPPPPAGELCQADTRRWQQN